MQLARRIANRLNRELGVYKLIEQRKREFENDPNNHPELVAEGCEDRSEKNVDDLSILERIILSYNKAKIAQREVKAAYLVSNEWLPIYESKLKGVMNALAEQKVVELAKMYRNFYRDPCSYGLVGMTEDMKGHYFSGDIKQKYQRLYLYDVLCRYKLWRCLLGDGYTAQDLASPNIGNPFGLVLDGAFVSSGSDYLHYYATEISRLAATIDHDVVVEIGGGFGGMAYYLLRDNAGVTYVDFDLPENLALTAYYLLRAFPGMKIALYGEEELGIGAVENNRIVLMPNFEISKMPSMSAAVAFNSYSLAEMSAETIAEYIEQMTRISRKYLFHVNHTKNSLVKADEFGIEKYGYKLLNRKPALWNRGRMLEVDEYEFLYSRSNQARIGNINADDN